MFLTPFKLQTRNAGAAKAPKGVLVVGSNMPNKAEQANTDTRDGQYFRLSYVTRKDG